MFSEQISQIRNRLPPLFVTLCLEVSLLLVYLLGMLFYPYQLLEQSSDMTLQWGQINELILQGEWYRLITAFWIHGNLVHLVSNLLFLLIFSTRLEDLVRGYLVFLVFLGSGLIGNLATLGFILLGVDFISLGASGAVFGLLGAVLFVLKGKSKRERRSMAYFIFIFFVITIGQDTNFISHLFGLVGGYYVMKLLDTR
ncbi:MAG: rhomboid family intramembrane serine protease [Candidatus Hodarchaeales archaeon]